jgi:hypothetical protein
VVAAPAVAWHSPCLMSRQQTEQQQKCEGLRQPCHSSVVLAPSGAAAAAAAAAAMQHCDGVSRRCEGAGLCFDTGSSVCYKLDPSASVGDKHGCMCRHMYQADRLAMPS